jgi:signal transduction histidine kinase/ligand-binding sensor domain-containing protein
LTRFLIILCFFWTKLAAQDFKYSVQTPGYIEQPEVLKKAGIKKVHCFFKDSRNLVWIGTGNGLFRFDGTNVIAIRHVPGDKTTIPNSNIVSIAEGPDGAIWVGCFLGLAKVNPYDLKATVYREGLLNIPNDFDNRIFIAKDGKVWTANSKGLYFLDSKENKFKEAWGEKQSPGSTYIFSVAGFRNDSLLLGTTKEIIVISQHDFHFRKIGLPGVNLTHLYYDSRGNVWIGTWGFGCILTDSLFQNFSGFKWQKNIDSSLSLIVRGFRESNFKNEISMYMLLGGGVMKIPYRSSAPDFGHAIYYNTNKATSIAYCALAENGSTWIAGESGIGKFFSGELFFNRSPKIYAGIAQSIDQVEIKKKQQLLVSSWHGNEGVVLAGEEAKLKRLHQLLQEKKGTSCSGVVMDKYGRSWFSSFSGIYVLDDQYRVIYDFEKEAKDKNKLTSNKTNGIALIHDTVWVLNYKKGIDLYDLRFQKINHFSYPESGLKEDLLWRVFNDRHGGVWILGNTYFYRYRQGRFKAYDLSAEGIGIICNDIAELPDGHFLIATENGLLNFNPVTEKFYSVTSPLLEKDNDILSLCIGATGDAWMITEENLVHYVPAKNQFTLFGKEDGLGPGNLQWIRTFDGENFILAEDGRLTTFTPSHWEKQVEQPAILINGVQVNDSSYVFDKPVHELQLNYDQNKIYFEFDAIGYSKPEQNKYAYMLTGVDKDWHISNRNFTSYSNLSPGQYKFLVKAANYSGNWSKEYEIDISIRPPFWKTWWFLAVAILVFTTAFILVVRYVSQRNLREKILRLEKEQAVEKERNRIARDVHDDLGSGLTKIAILSEVTKTQLDKKETASAQLEKISSSSRELVDNLQDIIWVLNPKNDSLENLAAYIREYALKFFDGTDISVKIDFPSQLPSLKLSEEERRNIFLVVKETLNNAAKYAGCSLVHIELVIQKQELQLIIRDNGKGFELNRVRTFGNGLLNMRTRMEQVNGKFEICSEKQKGTITTLSVPANTFMG